jgi:S-DNA-T family DNA segregation ATPase FtsK/SpoIIIE
MWTLGIRPVRESGLPAVDVVVRAEPVATVRDLAAALGRHLAPGTDGLLVVPIRDGAVWPAGQLLSESGLRGGDLLDVVAVPPSWQSAPGAPVRRRATLRVLTGPDAGLEVGLVGDSATIGRAPTSTVRLTDLYVSRHHARLLLEPRPMLVDEGSVYGTKVAGARVNRPTAVEYGVPIKLGRTVVALTADLSDPSGRGGTGVLRPPRFGEPLTKDKVEIDAPPTKPKQNPLPWIMMLMPLLGGVTALTTTHNSNGLIYMLGYPVLMVAAFFQQRGRARKEHREALKTWYAEVTRVLDRLDHHASAQRARGVADHPHPADLPKRVVTRHPGLWTRGPASADFLGCRVGIGPVPALLTASIRDGGEREPRARAMAYLAQRLILPEMPVVVPFHQAKVLALVGARDEVDAATRAMVVRLCFDHSPSELTIAGVLGERRLAHESWLRWLPHTGRRIGGLAPIAVGPVDGSALLDQLATDDGRGVTICLVDADAGLARRQIEAVAQVAGDRLRLLWLGDRPETVPASTDVVIDLTASVPASVAKADARAAGISARPVAVVARRDRAGVDLMTTIDAMSLSEAWRTARTMTTYTDEVSLLPPENALPGVARVPDVAGLDDPDDVNEVLERWAARRSLRGQVGMGVDGVVTIDLREDGPHGLVAGTTGSGKSELLQTLICSLALNNPPERISFLLVDYKGGAAFRECADLPHTVGYVTDLSPALVARALTSLYAEVSAREELLAEYSAKDLIALERHHPDKSPPSLLICVDEFAALTAEVPDFVNGMVNIAQRGRSLGVHLILATQRPAGVITANIRANTDLRIALRVASTDDSNDVLDRPDAAHISRRTPGRAWIRRTGHGTDELVQVAWVGARAPIAGTAPPVEVFPFSANLSAPAAAHGQVPMHPRSDLERLVTTIGEAFVRSGRPAPTRPWLPPLPVELPLGASAPTIFLGAGALDAEYAPGATTDVVRVDVPPGQVPIGVVDQPGRRAQPPLVLDYPQVGHVLVFGTSGSGKTELLRTVAVAASMSAPDLPPCVYAFDFGGGGLLTLADWPTIGSVVPEQDLGRVMRLLRMLRATVTDRNRILAASGEPDIGALAAAGQPMRRIHVLIDNLPAMVEALEGNPIRQQHCDMLASVLADGRRVGVHITATAPRRSGLPAAMQASFLERLVLRMTTDDDYAMLGVPNRVLDSDTPAGRGLSGKNEFQIATVGGIAMPPAQRLARLAAKLPDPSTYASAPVPGMPGRVPYQAMPQPVRDRLAIAVDADFVGAVTVPLLEAPLVVAGRARSGRTSMLAGLAGLARRSDQPPAQIVLIGAKAADTHADVDSSLGTPEDVLAWLPTVSAAAEPGEWRLILIDDAHLWEREWEVMGVHREAVAGLASLVGAAAGLGLAIVVATDVDDARSRQHVAGVVSAARKARRGILLQPDFSDGNLFSIMVPSQVPEPLSGVGRGLYCVDASMQIVQVVGVPEGVEHAAVRA